MGSGPRVPESEVRRAWDRELRPGGQEAIGHEPVGQNLRAWPEILDPYKAWAWA